MGIISWCACCKHEICWNEPPTNQTCSPVTLTGRLLDQWSLVEPKDDPIIIPADYCSWFPQW